ncbi:MAG: hypothetical protein GY765_29670 [bacterium]|nr:hypothetical protein [bacterium]
MDYMESKASHRLRARDNRKHRPGIAGRLKVFREYLGLDTKGMAAFIKITSNTYRKKERGQSLPGLKALSLMATEHNLSLDWLFLGKGPMITDRGAGAENYKTLKVQRDQLLEKQTQFIDIIEKLQKKLKKVSGNQTDAIRKVKAEFLLENRELENTQAEEIERLQREKEQLLRSKAPAVNLSPELMEMLDYFKKHPSQKHKVLSFYFALKEK